MDNSKLILFMGDSLTDCKRDREDDRSLGYGFASMVAGSLAVSEPGRYRFLNRGIGGNRIDNLIGRMIPDVIAHKPDYMSITVGANDFSGDYFNGNHLRIEKFEKLYSVFIEECLEEIPGLKIMLIAPFIHQHKGLENDYGHLPYFSTQSVRKSMDEYAAAVSRVAERYSLPCMQLQGKFDAALKDAPVEYWSLDGWHPTSMGHGIIHREWLKLFEEMKD